MTGPDDAKRAAGVNDGHIASVTTDASVDLRHTHIPLVVDLDGTLVRSDTLFESILLLCERTPWQFPRILQWISQGRTVLKHRLAERVVPDASSLPYNQELLDYLALQRHAGRSITLATAAHRRIADAVAAHVGLFDTVLATDDDVNLKGTAKLDRIRREVGADFVYAGDSAADLAVWEGARAAVLVGASKRIRLQVERGTHVELLLPTAPTGPRVWLRALRVHQWAKNALLFVPLFTAFAFVELQAVERALAAFLAFSLLASATYLVNDLLDLEKDRRHPRKRLRPLAAGTISIPSAVGAAAALLIAALAIAWTLPVGFGAALLAYLASTLLYTFRLKAMLLVDVIALACLFTLRIIAGALAIDVRVSVWLFAFSVFMFTSLALVKRCAELHILRDGLLRSGGTGRGYRASDMDILVPLGVATGVAAVLVFGLFVSSSGTSGRYASPELLWLVCVGLLYWIARIWVKTLRNEMHEDPVQFALRDRASRAVLLCCIGVVVAARWIAFPTLTD